MADDRTRNFNIWKDAEVWVSTKADPKVDADGSFGTAWDYVGLLGDGTSIGQELQIDRTDIKSFAGVKQMTDPKFSHDQRTFTALEDNSVTFSLLWPGSTFVQNGSGVLMAPETDAEVYVAFKTTNSFGDVLVDASRRKARVYASGRDKTDSGADTKEFTVEVYKDDDGALYDSLRIRKTGTGSVEVPEVIRISSTTPATP